VGIDDSFHKGLKAYRDGKYQEAVQLLYSAVSENEKNHKAWNALGVTFSKMGRLEEAVTCYENALKYDPGNTSYEQNRNQIVQKAYSKLPQSPDLERPSPVRVDIRRFFLPSIILIILALIAIFMLVIPSFHGNSDSGQLQPIPIPDVTPVEIPEETTVLPKGSDKPYDQNRTGSGDKITVPKKAPSIPEGAFMIMGDLIGKYYNGLSEVTFSMGIPEGGSPQYLPRVNYLWSVGTMDPIPVLPTNPASGTMKPGETQTITIQIPANQQPRAGEKFSLEVRPATGTSITIATSLPSNYKGGIIRNPMNEMQDPSIQPSPAYLSIQPVNDSYANLVLDDSINGYYSDELEQLIITLRVPATGIPQDLTRLTYLWSTGTGTPVTISRLNLNPSSGTINPGEQQLLMISIPEGSRPRAGESFTLEIKPDIGQSIMKKKILLSSYKGGTIF
jgi:archaellin